MFEMITIKDIAKAEIIQQAFEHVFNRRKNSHHNNDIWHLVLNWQSIKQNIINQLTAGTYNLSPMKHYPIDSAGQVGVWCSQDAIILKAIAIVLEKPIKQRFDLQDVTHVKGHGGLKYAVAKAQQFCKSNNPFIYKTDVKDFYQSIDHQILIQQLEKITNDPKLLKILENYCQRVDIVNGEYILVDGVGIPKGCSLSPLMGAIYLNSIDKAAKQANVKYLRYMDDLLFVSDTRWKLKKLIKKVHVLLKELKQVKSYQKTWIGRAKQGFDWLGFHIKVESITVALKTLLNHRNKISRLYEQGVSKGRIEEYCKRWKSWCCVNYFKMLTGINRTL